MAQTTLLTGATGMVGSQVLDLLLANPDVGQVTSLGRRTTDVRHEKLRDILVEDFMDLSGVASQLTGIDVCFHCLGVYQGQVSEAEFFEITCDYQKALTDALAQGNPDAIFVLFGASGADPSEGSRALFARAKGRAERLLDETPFPQKYIFRPGYIHPTGGRKPPGLAYKMLLPIAGALFKVVPSIGIADRDLAQAMVTTGLAASAPSAVFENRDIRRIAGL